MTNLFYKILSFYLIFFFLTLPLAEPAYAARTPRKNIAVVEVYEQSPSAELNKMHHKVEYFLSKNQNIFVTSGTRVTKSPVVNNTKSAATPATDIQTQMWTPGDDAYIRAKEIYINADFRGALQQARSAISMLKAEPGINGNLVNACLLESQAYFELGNDDAAMQSALTAISYNVDLKSLNSIDFSPRMRFLYKDAYEKFMSQNTLTDMTINVEGGEALPIYVNGVLKGTDSSITIQVPKNTVQYISTGQSVFVHTVKGSRRDNTIAVGAFNRNLSVYPNENYSSPQSGFGYLGLQNTFFPTLIKQAQGMGLNLNTGLVALIKLEPVDKKQHQLLLTVVDAKKGYATPSQLFEIPDIEVDADRVARMASSYITSVTPQEFAKIDADVWNGSRVAAFYRAEVLKHNPIYNDVASANSGLKSVKTPKYPGDELDQITPPGKRHKDSLPLSDQDAARRKNKNRTIMYIAIGAGAILLGGGIAAAVALSGGSSNTSSGGGGGGGGLTEGDSTTVLTGPIPTTP